MAGKSNKNAIRNLANELFVTTVIELPRAPTTTDVKNAKNGQRFVPITYCRDSSTGNLWYLAGFTSGDADWRLLAGGGGSVTDLRDQVNALVTPAAGGYIDVDGATVANGANPSGIPLETVAGTNTLTIQQQVAAAVTGAPADKNDAGICSFDDTEFVVDANGNVSLVGTANAPAIQKIDGDGGGVVGPDGTGRVFYLGKTVANGTRAKPLWTEDTPGTNTMEFEIQVATARTGAPADKNDSGLSSYNDTQFTVDANGYVSLIGGTELQKVGVRNLGITYASSTLSVASADGTALSSSNIGYVTMQSAASPGQLETFEVTANQGFIDASGASELTGALLGMTTGVAWNVDFPVFIYAVRNSDPGTNLEPSIAFMFSRAPHATVAPVAGKIADPSAASNASTQGSFFSFDDITQADYAGQPCLCIGSFRMRKATTADDFTVQALSAEKDGIGMFQETIDFTFPSSQNGAASGKYFIDNGGTAPGFTSNAAEYRIFRTGLFNYEACHETCNATGVGAVEARATLPFKMYAAAPIRSTCGIWVDDSASAGNFVLTRDEDTVSYTTFTTDGSLSNLTNGAINANDSICYVKQSLMSLS